MQFKVKKLFDLFNLFDQQYEIRNTSFSIQMSKEREI